MALQNLVGSGLLLPPLLPGGFSATTRANVDVTLDADEEEYQIIGRIRIDGGASKTFGTSGSKIDWLPGASITFASGSTVRVGVKKASQVDAANGPAARATIGAAAFDVYDDLVGGTDAISSTTWRSDSMSAGTPYTVANGDLIAVCFHLDTTSGTPSVKVRGMAPASAWGFPALTLVTSGPTYTAQTALPNVILTFDDGTLGWIDGTTLYAVGDSASGNIGNTNIVGNVFQVPFSCAIDAIVALVNPSAGGADFSLVLYSTPLGTPAVVEAIAFDANQIAVTGTRWQIANLTTPRTLTINTDYAIAVRQDSATNLTVPLYDVSVTTHFKVNGMGAECYAANSTAGATFAQQNSGKRRYHIYARISQLDDGATAGGGLIRHPGMQGGLNA